MPLEQPWRVAVAIYARRLLILLAMWAWYGTL